MNTVFLKNNDYKHSFTNVHDCTSTRNKLCNVCIKSGLSESMNLLKGIRNLLSNVKLCSKNILLYTETFFNIYEKTFSLLEPPSRNYGDELEPLLLL